MNNSKNILIVDPVSSGYYLTEAAFRRGWKCHALLTSSDKKDTIQPYQQWFSSITLIDLIDEEILPEKVINNYKKMPLDAVIAGSESGVYLAESVAAILNLAGNNPKSSILRRNKYHMQEALRKNGLRMIRQYLVDNEKDAILKSQALGTFPIVLKPTESAGTDGVYFCHNEEEIRAAFKAIYQQKNLFGVNNDHVLIQEYIPGDEYIVDVVLKDDYLRTGGIFKYRKQKGPTGAPLYRSIDLLPFSGEKQQKLLAYSKEVLHALDLHTGPAHIEIKMQDGNDAQPTLIELGARMHGGYGPVFSRFGSGICQLDLTMALLSGEESFFAQDGYEISNETIEFFMISKEEGKVEKWLIDDFLPTLESFKLANIWAKEKGKLLVTKDLFSSPGIVVLSHPDKSIVQKNFDQLVHAEETHLLFALEQNN